MPRTAAKVSAITVVCGHCREVLRIPSSYAGKRGKCPRCDGVVDVQREPSRSKTRARTRRKRREAEPAPRAAAPTREEPPETSGETASWNPLTDDLLKGGALGGTMAMVAAVVWFVAGLAAGRIFFYPPVLFVMGLGVVVKDVLAKRRARPQLAG